jgi:hypothetical protein
VLWGVYVIETYLLHCHLKFFPENMGAFSIERDGRFHLDISEMEERRSGKWSQNMLADNLLDSCKGDAIWRI